MSFNIIKKFINLDACPLENSGFISKCIKTLNKDGALTIPNFINKKTLTGLIKEAEENQHKAFYSNSTHNVYLTPINNDLPTNHIYNLQISSSKGCITTDQIPENSGMLKFIFNCPINTCFYKY